MSRNLFKKYTPLASDNPPSSAEATTARKSNQNEN